jgi:PIN domain nuclease of toxin-antitoxin system
MRFLLDTHLLIWSLIDTKRISARTRRLMEDESNDLYFSVVSLWEIGVKRALNRPEFNMDPHLLRGELLSEGYTELSVTADHALAVEQLPPLHKDPFDRLLLCQTLVEGLTLLTKDEKILAYPVSVRRQ